VSIRFTINHRGHSYWCVDSNITEYHIEKKNTKTKKPQILVSCTINQ